MPYDICILAPTDSFARLLLLECGGRGKSVICAQAQDNLPAANLYIIDADVFSILPEKGNILRYGRHLSDTQYGEEKRTVTELHRPVSLSRLRAYLEGRPNDACPIIALAEDGRSARVGTCTIPLTPKEYACLRCLLAADGRPVSRKELYAAAWGKGECEEKLVNLYLHYLRKKLEASGHRLIFSIRGFGYYLKQEEGTV